jgi:hypothetical protein
MALANGAEEEIVNQAEDDSMMPLISKLKEITHENQTLAES